jgi:hypothetical protein
MYLDPNTLVWLSNSLLLGSFFFSSMREFDNLAISFYMAFILTMLVAQAFISIL